MSKTPISILQEIMAQRKEMLPVYCIEHSNMEYAPFKCTVKVDSIKAVGYATSKKDAKQNSAKIALEMLGYSTNPSQTIIVPSCSKSVPVPFINFVGKLNELASTHHTSYPVYCEKPVAMAKFLTECSFMGFSVKGYGLNKKESKQDAAKKMLQQLKEVDLKKITVQIENVHLESKSSPLTQEIKNIYDKLQVTLNNTNSKASSVTISSVPTLKAEVYTMADLKRELQDRGYKYEITTFQDDPFIMMMKICDSNVTIMGKGETKQLAMNDLFENVLYMFEHGFDIST